MRRRALLAASTMVGSNGVELPIIPDGFFPLYLKHDSYSEIQHANVFNSSDTTRELWNIVYGYTTILGEYDGYGYDFYPEDYGIEVYLDGILITNFYASNDTYIGIFSDDPWGEGNIDMDGSLFFCYIW